MKSDNSFQRISAETYLLRNLLRKTWNLKYTMRNSECKTYKYSLNYNKCPQALAQESL